MTEFTIRRLRKYNSVYTNSLYLNRRFSIPYARLVNFDNRIVSTMSDRWLLRGQIGLNRLQRETYFPEGESLILTPVDQPEVPVITKLILFVSLSKSASYRLSTAWKQDIKPKEIKRYISRKFKNQCFSIDDVFAVPHRQADVRVRVVDVKTDSDVKNGLINSKTSIVLSFSDELDQMRLVDRLSRGWSSTPDGFEREG